MNHELLRQKLLAAARCWAPSEAAPYAFERRVMARIAASGALPDPWSAWGALLWHAVAPCCVVMILVGIGTFALSPSDHDLGDQLDAVLMAGLDSDSHP
jgi:hypothetical protein